MVHTLLYMDTNRSKINTETCRAVVTETAVVTALGNNLEDQWCKLIQQESAIRPVTRFPVDQEHYQATIAALIDESDPSAGPFPI